MSPASEREIREGMPEMASLSGLDPGRLFTDRPRRKSLGRRRSSVSRRLPASLADELKRRSSNAEMMVLATVLILLERHSGQPEQEIGLELSSSRRLPIRLRLDTRAGFDELLERTGEAIRRAGSARARREGPASTTRVAFEAPNLLPSFEPEEGAPLENPIELRWRLEPADGGFVLRLEYASELFQTATARRLLEDHVALLEASAADPARPLAELPLAAFPEPPPWQLPAADGFRPPPAPRPGETFVERFRRVAAELGDRPALQDPDERISYRELDRVTDEWAAALRCELGAPSRVALLFPHQAAAVVAVLSVLKSGAAYVPLDPTHPDSRLQEILSAADVAAVFCHPAFAARARSLVEHLPVLSASALSPGTSAAGAVRARADDLAYLLFTSGSTGRPKAVMQSRRNLLAHAVRYAERVRLSTEDRVPMLARYTFDAGVMDLFGSLVSGACLCIVDPLGEESSDLPDALAGADVTLLHSTPTLFRFLGERLEILAEKAPPLQIRGVVLGGEEVTSADLALCRRLFPAAFFINGLGPTECTVALQHLATAADLELGSVPVGHPVEGVEFRLEGADGRPTQVFGELVLRSELVATGYWREEEQTAAAFIRDGDGRRAYRTGDLVRRRADGGLVYCGRRNRQVKIRGHRVEPGEAETLLRAHPTVAQAAVVADTSRPRGPRLLGYVTSSTMMPADALELEGYLRRHLPEYCVPSHLVVLEELPRGPTGKLDRARLPSPPEKSTKGREPQSATAKAVAALWSRILGVSAVSLDDDFIWSGGDSLQILELLSGLRQEHGADIALPQFIRQPTLEALVELVEAGRPASAHGAGQS